MRTKRYIVRAQSTAVMGTRQVEEVWGRDLALRMGRHLSKNGREVTVRRHRDGVLIGAFHSGHSMKSSEVYLDDFSNMGEPGDLWHHLTLRSNDLPARV